MDLLGRLCAIPLMLGIGVVGYYVMLSIGMTLEVLLGRYWPIAAIAPLAFLYFRAVTGSESPIGFAVLFSFLSMMSAVVLIKTSVEMVRRRPGLRSLALHGVLVLAMAGLWLFIPRMMIETANTAVSFFSLLASSLVTSR
jgi:hypothetical protein